MEAQVKSKTGLTRVRHDKELMKPGEMGAVLELVVKDKSGKVTERRTMRSESFVRQFLEMLFCQVAGIFYRSGQPYSPTVVYAKDIGGHKRPVFTSDEIFNAAGGVGNTSMGITVGTGTTLPTMDDYQLEAICGHGSGANQFEYGGVTYGLPTSDATTSHFTITRDFANNSPGLVTVSEIGLYVKAEAVRYGGWTEDRYFMVIRDVISGGIDVPVGQTLTVNYREQAVV